MSIKKYICISIVKKSLRLQNKEWRERFFLLRGPQERWFWLKACTFIGMGGSSHSFIGGLELRGKKVLGVIFVDCH